MKELWPPPAGAKTHTIRVSVDRWHSMIAVAHNDTSSARGDAQLWEEWGYAEKGYYLEGDTGCSGTLWALFVPSAGVVQVTHTRTAWSERTPQPPARSWTFRLSETGYERLCDFLEREKKSAEVISTAGGYSWYRADESYHVFHHCYHWTARALRAAGLPVWSFYAPLKSCLEAQLNRALTFQGDGNAG